MCTNKFLASRFVLLVLLCCHSSLSAKLFLDSDNKFQNLLIFIDDNVQESDKFVLDRIKDHINNASKSLWIATSNLDPNKGGVQFGTVYIKVPESWNVDSVPITWQQCTAATFFITINNQDGDKRPFTKHIGKCGEPGKFTRFPEAFFQQKSLNETIIAGRQIMNEFVKLRYGVFSEKPMNNFLRVFNGSGHIDGVCGHSIKWKLNVDEKRCVEKNSVCRYSILPNQSHNYSVMFDEESYNSEYFCDNNHRRHNKYAKNLHNKKCNMESVTTVILRHADFNENKQTKPFENVKFEIVKGKSRKIALVLDTSSSMTGIIGNMIKATVEFLKAVEDTAFVGIVDFNTYGINHTSLVPTNSNNNRKYLIDIVNRLQPTGSTNIPDGLAKGVEVLGGNINSADKMFGTIILLTDGQNNQNVPYDYDFVINQIIRKGILVNSIAYGTAADAKINKLTTGTGGKYFFADPNTVYLDLLAKLSVKQSCEIVINQEIKLVESVIPIDITAKVQMSNLQYIDEYVGSNVKLTITIPTVKKDLKLTLLSPSKKKFSVSQEFSQIGGITYVFNIPGKPEVGMYQIELVSPQKLRLKRSTETFLITLTISAKTDSTTQRIINPTGDLSDSEIDMLTDETKILATVDMTTCGITKDENVSVTLFMDTPSQKNIEKIMTDDGQGDDSVEDDKIFSTSIYAKDLSTIGFYSFRANAEIHSNKTEDVIKRTVELGSLRVKNKQSIPIQDKVPPSKIEDVSITTNDTENRIIKVQFNAPGNDGLIGSITKYQISINYTTETPPKYFLLDMISNAKSRELVEFFINMKNYYIDKPFELSVRGIDDNNNKAEWSLPQIYEFKFMAVFEDKQPPLQIGNFNITAYNETINIKKIQFSLLDDDISGYEVRINASNVFYEIIPFKKNNTNISVELYINIDKYNITDWFEVSVRGIDANNNKAEWSAPQFYEIGRFKSSSERIFISYKLFLFCVLVLFI